MNSHASFVHLKNTNLLILLNVNISKYVIQIKTYIYIHII